MKIEIEVSRPHYHPSHESVKLLSLTKKRDLSVPPHWVANERVTNPESNQSFAVVMPPRDEELYEHRQPIHVHMDETTLNKLNESLNGTELESLRLLIKGKDYLAKVKVSPANYTFEPKVHIDHIQSEMDNINSGDLAETVL